MAGTARQAHADFRKIPKTFFACASRPGPPPACNGVHSQAIAALRSKSASSGLHASAIAAAPTHCHILAQTQWAPPFDPPPNDICEFESYMPSHADGSPRGGKRRRIARDHPSHAVVSLRIEAQQHSRVSGHTRQQGYRELDYCRHWKLFSAASALGFETPEVLVACWVGLSQQPCRLVGSRIFPMGQLL
jgi:hypothetical protein